MLFIFLFMFPQIIVDKSRMNNKLHKGKKEDILELFGHKGSLFSVYREETLCKLTLYMIYNISLIHFLIK